MSAFWGRFLMVFLHQAREHKRLGGADSTGVACGEEIRQRVREEMYGLYEERGVGQNLLKTHMKLTLHCSVDLQLKRRRVSRSLDLGGRFHFWMPQRLSLQVVGDGIHPEKI